MSQTKTNARHALTKNIEQRMDGTQAKIQSLSLLFNALTESADMGANVGGSLGIIRDQLESYCAAYEDQRTELLMAFESEDERGRFEAANGRAASCD
jgi:hypothetical protein